MPGDVTHKFQKVVLIKGRITDYFASNGIAGSKSLTAAGREKLDDRIVKVDGMEKDESSRVLFAGAATTEMKSRSSSKS